MQLSLKGFQGGLLHSLQSVDRQKDVSLEPPAQTLLKLNPVGK